MFDDTLHIPLKFYDALEKQDFRKGYSTNRRVFQITDTTHLPEFQIKLGLNDTFTSIALVNADTDVDDSYTFGTGWSGQYEIKNYTTDAFSQLIYYRGASLNPVLPTGDYYLKVTTASDIYYSEVFSVLSDITDHNILVWHNGTKDLGNIVYNTTTQFKSTFIFSGTLAKPDYVIEEEGTEDGDGNTLITFQRRVKTYKLWFYAPEHIADAVSLIPLHDYVELTTHYGESNSQTGQVYDFLVTTEWLESKGLAKITCEFRDQPIIKTTCANNFA